MTNHFDIICNNCGQNIPVRPSQGYVTCSTCQTHLKIEETATTITATIISNKEFLTVNKVPIPVNPPSYQNQQQTYFLYEQQLRILETEWLKKEESFKLKKGNTRILPRKTQSFSGAIISLITVLISVFTSLDSVVLYIVGGVWFFSNVREYYKALKYEAAQQDYLDEKERLETAINLLT